MWTGEDIALWIIVVQGFFVMFYEYDVWRMNRDRFEERKQWRDAKRKQQTKKSESEAADAGRTRPERVDLPVSQVLLSPESSDTAQS